MTSEFMIRTRKAIAVASMSTLLAMGLVSVSSAPANAAACTNSAITVGDGLGAGTAFQISTPAQLQWLTLQMNAANADGVTAGKFYKVTANLDFAGCDFTSSSGGFPFKGNFDGGDFTISNYRVSGSSYAALFGQAKGAVLKDIVIDGATVSGGSYTGALVGLADLEGTPTILNNIRVRNSSVVGGSNVGGIAGGAFRGSGDNLNLLRVEDTDVTGEESVGGVIGRISNYPSLNKSGFFGGTVTRANSGPSHRWIGGLVGLVEHNFAMSQVAFRGDLDLTSGTATEVGFLLGRSLGLMGITHSYVRGQARVSGATVVSGTVGEWSVAPTLTRGYVRISVLEGQTDTQVGAYAFYEPRFSPLTGWDSRSSLFFFDSELHTNWLEAPPGREKTSTEMETYSTFGPLSGWSFGNPGVTAGTWYWNDNLEGKLFLLWEYEGLTITPCPTGKYSFNGVLPCVDTSPGSFSSLTGSITPDLCPAGTFQANFGAASCVPAQAGYFVATPGQTAETQCAAGTNSDAGATSCFSTATSYQGPIVSSTPKVASAGEQVVFSGERLSQVSSVSISGKSALATCTDTSCSFTVPEGVSAGLQDLVLLGSHGALTIQAGIRIEEVVTAEETAVLGWTKKISDSEVKVYAKNLVGAGKVQYFVNGKEVAWVRAADQSDPKLRFANGASYLVRTLTLVEGQKNVIEIHVDGERLRRVAYTR